MNERSNCAVHFPAGIIATDTGRILGRHSATIGFLRGLARHGGAAQLYCCAPSKQDFDAFRRFVAECGSQAATHWVSYANPGALRAAGCLYQPDPGIAELAWHRSRFGSGAFSLCGVTHTLCSMAAIDMIAGLAIAPVEPWDAVVCTSRAARMVVRHVLDSWEEYLEKRLGATRRAGVELPVIPLGVDCDAFAQGDQARSWRAQLRDGLRIGPDEIAILFVGRLSYHAKAHPLPMYLAAEEVARRTGKRLHLLHFGWFANDSQREHFVAAARQACPSVTAHFLDQQQQWRESIWTAADIFCSLSDNIQETFGLTPIEAMAAGLPQVVSDWSGYRDTVRHGVDGFRVPTLVPPPRAGEDLMARYAVAADTYDFYVGNVSQSTVVDVAACVEALERLVVNPELRASMGAAARERALETYDWRVVIRAYQDLWSELAARREVSAGAIESQPRAHPLREDPFSLFAEFATCPLDDTCIVDVGPNSARRDQIESLAMNRFSSSGFCNEEEMAALVSEIGDEAPILVGDLLDRVSPLRRPFYYRTIAWLAKMDIVRVSGLGSLVS